MKSPRISFSFLIVVSLLQHVPLHAQQQLLNGGFEETFLDFNVYEAGHEVPMHWRFGYYPMHDGVCPYTGKMTTDSHSGDWAVELETSECSPNVPGSIYYSVGNPEMIAPVINDRPDQLSFYYKFSTVGGDSATFNSLLFNFPDSLSVGDPGWFEAIDTVAYIDGIIPETTDQYTQRIANFEYWSNDVPEYILLWFSTSKNYLHHPSTTLWVDDVELIYLSTSSKNQLSAPDIQVFPNPVTHQFQIEVPGYFQPQSIVVFDNVGRVVRTMNPQDRFHSMNNLASGIYFIRIETEAGSVVKKLVKE